MLFQTHQRTSWGIRKYTESYFNFIDRSAWPICAFARNFIDKWLSILNADNNLLSKLKSKDDRQHDATMAELLFFAICKSYGLDIQNIATMQNIKTPDFKVDLPGSNPIIVECSLASNALESAEDHAKNLR